MSLDRNLFTLNVTPNESDPTVQDLVDQSGNVHYHKQREGGTLYRINLFDPMSQAMLASATAPSPTSKHKTIELHNPTHIVELKSIGTLTFKWSFTWEEHVFEWKREECYLIRKPDPAVLVAITKEPPGKLKTSAIQILDYNLNRFDIVDRKGLEITLLTALLTFQDSNAASHAPTSPPEPVVLAPPPQPEGPPPSPPPRPNPKTGVDRIAEMHALRYEPNEVTVNEEGSVEDYGQYAESLFADDAMLFITVRSASPADVPKVLQVVEQVKRLRHKREVSVAVAAEELHQYVNYDTRQAAPRRIKLDDPPANAYTPPTSVTVHLSKISMPELRPRPTAPKSPPASAAPRFPTPAVEKAAHRSPPPPQHKQTQKQKQRTPSPPRRPRLRTPKTPPGFTPSPAQPGNPQLYSAPPPPPPAPPAHRTSVFWGRSRK
ncbi:hypothetical protein BC834DRAFT_974329 [Gloeopeniophorella convolvens]|nr:hypothetical protein BC834DRAFT_974329 [Gloeopeniophorella convolvens]